jgi:hypothetical protein
MFSLRHSQALFNSTEYLRELGKFLEWRILWDIGRSPTGKDNQPARSQPDDRKSERKVVTDQGIFFLSQNFIFAKW